MRWSPPHRASAILLALILTACPDDESPSDCPLELRSCQYAEDELVSCNTTNEAVVCTGEFECLTSMGAPVSPGEDGLCATSLMEEVDATPDAAPDAAPDTSADAGEASTRITCTCGDGSSIGGCYDLSVCAPGERPECTPLCAGNGGSSGAATCQLASPACP